MAEILKPIAPAGAVRRVDPERNLLVLAGTGAELQNMLEAIEVFDADWMAGKSFGLFKLEHTDPTSVVAERFYAGEDVGVEPGTVRSLQHQPLQAATPLSLDELVSGAVYSGCRFVQ